MPTIHLHTDRKLIKYLIKDLNDAVWSKYNFSDNEYETNFIIFECLAAIYMFYLTPKKKESWIFINVDVLSVIMFFKFNMTHE